MLGGGIMTTRTATTIGLIAILLWSMLALFTAATGTSRRSSSPP